MQTGVTQLFYIVLGKNRYVNIFFLLIGLPCYPNSAARAILDSSTSLACGNTIDFSSDQAGPVNKSSVFL